MKAEKIKELIHEYELENKFMANSKVYKSTLKMLEKATEEEKEQYAKEDSISFTDWCNEKFHYMGNNEWLFKGNGINEFNLTKLERLSTEKLYEMYKTTNK